MIYLCAKSEKEARGFAAKHGLSEQAVIVKEPLDLEPLSNSRETLQFIYIGQYWLAPRWNEVYNWILNARDIKILYDHEVKP